MVGSEQVGCGVYLGGYEGEHFGGMVLGVCCGDSCRVLGLGLGCLDVLENAAAFEFGE